MVSQETLTKCLLHKQWSDMYAVNKTQRDFNIRSLSFLKEHMVHPLVPGLPGVSCLLRAQTALGWPGVGVWTNQRGVG